MHWIEFFISAAVIICAGIQLTTYADKLSDELHLGKIWIGIILLGLVTSLPEAITSLVSVVSLGANDLAVGNLLGSNNFNPLLIVVMDIMYRQGSVTNAIRPNVSHKISASFAILLVSIVIADIMINVPVVMFGTMSLSMGSILIAVCYFIGIIQLAQNSSGSSVIAQAHKEETKQNKTLFRIGLHLLVSGILVIVGAMWLARSADAIAQQTGIGGTFFGSIFLAIVTSLPEMVVSLAALRLGSMDLAIGNIFGSNMTNMFILFVCSLFHRGGPILGTVSRAHIVTASLSILLTFIVIKGIYTRNKRTVLGLGWDSLIMVFFFTAGTIILYKLRLI